MQTSYILCLVTGTELKAAKELEAIGISTVCPMRPTTRRNPKNRKKVEVINVPVLPGYIVVTGIDGSELVSSYEWSGRYDGDPAQFAKQESGERKTSPLYRTITGLKEVRGFIETGGEPQPISQEVVDYVAALEGVEAQQLPFRLQQRVQILNDVGEPTGMYGTIAKLFGIKKAELELDRLGTATIDTGKLEAA